MSHKVSYWWIRITQVIPEFGGFYKNGGILLGGVSDCEELVGVTHRRGWVLVFRVLFFVKHSPEIF